MVSLLHVFSIDAPTSELYTLSLHDALPIYGRDVAVKVQYPGVASAVRADMQNLGMILRLMKGIAPGLDPKADRKSTRLNSSHMSISYAVFCLKKKKSIHQIYA